jgi:pyridoxine kinase
LERLGQLDCARAVMTGYFAAADQVEAVADRIARLKNRREDLVVLVDPVIGDDADGLYVDERAAVALSVPEVVATSVAAAGDQLQTLAIMRDGVARSASPCLAEVPHGTGDLLAGLYLGCRLSGGDAATSLGEAMAILQRAIAKSVGGEVLDLEAAC